MLQSYHYVMSRDKQNEALISISLMFNLNKFLAAVVNIRNLILALKILV